MVVSRIIKRDFSLIPNVILEVKIDRMEKISLQHSNDLEMSDKSRPISAVRSEGKYFA